MFRWQSCQSSVSTPLTSSLLSFVRCRFTLGFQRTNVKPLSVNTRPFMNDSGDRFALAQSQLSSRHGAAPRKMITAHRLRARRTYSILLPGPGEGGMCGGTGDQTDQDSRSASHGAATSLIAMASIESVTLEVAGPPPSTASTPPPSVWAPRYACGPACNPGARGHR